MHHQRLDFQEQIERIIQRHPLSSGECSQCAKAIYQLFTTEGLTPHIGRLETGARFLTTKDGIYLSRTIRNSRAYHEFVEVEEIVYDALSGSQGLHIIDYKNLFYEGVFDDGTVSLIYFTL